jgi:hypothetical protein
VFVRDISVELPDIFPIYSDVRIVDTSRRLSVRASLVIELQKPNPIVSLRHCRPALCLPIIDQGVVGAQLLHQHAISRCRRYRFPIGCQDARVQLLISNDLANFQHALCVCKLSSRVRKNIVSVLYQNVGFNQ